MGKHIKFKKGLGKRCPECEVGFLELTLHIKKNGGVEYSEEFIECTECSYHQKIFNKRDKDNFNPKW